MKKSGQNDPSFGQGLELAGIICKALNTTAKKLDISDEDVQKIIGKPGVIFNLVEGLFSSEKSSEVKIIPSITRLIESGVMIEACDGKTYISEAKNTFKSGIDGDFRNWKLNNKGNATEETLLDIHEIVEDARFNQIFTSINPDLDKLVVTQSQIIRFCEKHPTLLRQEGYATFFLIKENNEFFVVHLYMFSDGLSAHVHRFGRGRVWSGSCCRRVVFPQLVPQVA